MDNVNLEFDKNNNIERTSKIITKIIIIMGVIISIFLILQFFEDNKIYECEIVPFKIINENEKEITIKNIEDLSLSEESTLFFLAHHNELRIKESGKIILEYGHDTIFSSKTKLIGNPLIKIDLPKEIQEIEITFVKSNPKYSVSIPDIKIIETSKFSQYLLVSILPTIIISLFFIMLGSYLLLHFIYYKFINKKDSKYELAYISIFLFVFGMWLITDDPHVLCLFPNTEIVILTSFFLFSLLPLFFMLFFGELLKFKSAFYYKFIIILQINVLLNAFLQLFGIVSYIRTNIITHILFVISSILIIIKLYKEYKQSLYKNAKYLYLFTILYFIFAITALFSFYISNGSRYVGLYTLSVAQIFILVLYVKYKDDKKAREKITLLEENVYKDKLTNLLNQSAYLEEISVISGEFTIYIIDINNLKYINDNYGHYQGDIIIKRCAELLEKHFPLKNNKIFRIGGDEFVILSREKQSTKKLNSLYQDIENTNKNYNIKLSISIGFSSLSLEKPNIDKVKDTFHKADQMMYKEKENYYKSLTNITRRK